MKKISVGLTPARFSTEIFPQIVKAFYSKNLPKRKVSFETNMFVILKERVPRKGPVLNN